MKQYELNNGSQRAVVWLDKECFKGQKLKLKGHNNSWNVKEKYMTEDQPAWWWVVEKVLDD